MSGDPDRENIPIQLSLEGGSFEVAEDGAFFIGTIRDASPKPGVGLIEVAADGSSCRFVSMNKGDPGNLYDEGIGGGYDFGLSVETINHIDGQLYVMDNNSILRVDRETGMRERLMGYPYPGIMEYDASRDLFHVTALEPPYANGGFIVTLDLVADAYWMNSRCINIDDDHPYAEACVDGGQGHEHLNRNQAWLLPDGEHMITVNSRDAFGIIDIDTGVQNHFSF